MIQSPDGKIKAVIVAKESQLTYTVSVDNQQIIISSKLGLDLEKNLSLGKNVAILSANTRSSNTTWKNPLGKTSTVKDNYNELRLQLQEKSNGQAFEMVFRAYNDGLAFRYILPKKLPDSALLLNEQTEFTFSSNYKSFAGHHARYGYKGSQEWEFNPTPLDSFMPDSIMGLPLLVETPAAWVAVTEADLLDWAGMWLTKSSGAAPGNGVTLLAKPAPRFDKKGLVKTHGGQSSPWRVLMIGRKPGDLVESNLILNLASPSKIGDASWVKPGLVAWDHWWSGDVLMNTATLKEYIQLAADMGWPYQLIDWQWYGKYNTATADITSVNPDVDMDEVRRFAKEKNVKLWLWLYWTDVQRNDAYKKAFELYEKWGIAGVKIDFMDRDDQEMVNWYEKIAKATAEHHLMLNFHGAYKPTGLERTYPNQVTREGILGNEYSRWSTRITSEHKLTLPFTRLLAGPADFTPGGFQNHQPSTFKPDPKSAEVQGTRSSELALFVIYHSPITTVCDHPKNYKDQPGTDFLKVVPTVWDEIKVLNGKVSDYIVVAKRKGNEWFIGAMTDSTPRQLTISLAFLGEGKYTAQIWQDAKDSDVNAEHLDRQEKTLTSKDQLVLPMVTNGGFAARIQKAGAKN